MRIIFITILLIIASTFYAQETRVIVSEDSVAQSNEYDRLFNLLSENRTKINTLIKLNAVDWGQLSPSIIIEQRVHKNLTVEPLIRVDGFGVSQQTGLKYLITPEIRLKYYYNMGFRERQGKNINGFSGNYFVASFSSPFGDTPDLSESILNKTYFYDYDLSELEANKIHSIGMLHVGYGLQRRFMDFGYFDMAVGLNYQVYNKYIPEHKKLLPFIKIGIGFGFTPSKAKELTE